MSSTQAHEQLAEALRIWQQIADAKHQQAIRDSLRYGYPSQMEWGKQPHG